MGKLSLQSALLFALIIPFIMTYRIGPGETPYGLFGLIFLVLLLNLAIDMVKMNSSSYFILKSSMLWLAVGLVIGSSFVSVIIVRHNVAPVHTVHDIILQQEAAIRYFLDGINPYATTYFGTPLEDWHYADIEVNPALYHFVMPPFYLLFALPFYWISNQTIGYFDGRIPLYLLFLALLIMAFRLVKDKEKKLLFVTLLAFNPAMLGYILEGRSDVFMYAFLFAGFYLIHLGRIGLAGIPIGLAFAIKQSAWPILPFYITFLYLKTKNVWQTVKLLLSFILTFGIMILPFLLWDAQAFLDSTFFYLSGSSANSYPISGYGLGKFLNQIGVIADIHQYYPFVIWQILIGLPLIIFLIRFLKEATTVSRLILAYGIFLFVFWYLSRYFNNSHLGYLSMIFVTAYFWPEKEE